MEEGGELHREINRLGDGGDDVGERGGRGCRLLHKGLSGQQGRDVMYVGGVDGLCERR